MNNDSRKLLIIGLVAVVVIALGVVIGFSGALDLKASAGKLSVTPTNYSFGDVDIFGGKTTTSFEIANNGSEQVDIVSAQTTCMCTEAYMDGKTITMHQGIYIGIIKPGEKKRVDVSFDPLAHGPDAVGPIVREIIFKTDSMETPVVNFRFDGDVVKKPGAAMPVGTMTNHQQ